MFTLLIYSAAGRRCETKRVQTLARISGRRCSEWQQPFETQVSWEAQCHAASPCDEIKEPLRKAILKQLGLS